MKKQLKNTVCMLLCAALLLCALGGCAQKEKETAPALAACAIEHEPEFGGVYIKTTIDAFNALGFAYGDSVTVTFSNGRVEPDLPYYSGYYTQNGEALLVAYPGYPYIKVAINNAGDYWEEAGLSESDTAETTLAERGKYAAVQEARNISYKDDRSLFDSDAVFANFRSVKAGAIAEGRLFRSASPCDNQHNRAPYADALMREAGVRFILNLSDNEEKIAGYIADPDFNSPYFLSLYEEGLVEPIALNMNYGSEEFRQKVANGLAVMAEKEGPYLTHCTEGKDRTGFLCMLLEALCGADYEEIRADYMETYANYYGITAESEPDKYDTIVESVLDPMLASLISDAEADLRTADLSGGAESFLRSGGMSPEQIETLKTKLCAQE